MTNHPTRQKRPSSGIAESSAQKSSDLSRREWFLHLGGTAILMGFPGVPVEGQRGGIAEGESAQLPPGLYESSDEHMTHALASDDRYHLIPAGCETDFVRPLSGPFQPRFFSPAEFQVVKRLVASVLGESEGSAEGGGIISEVAEWIDWEVFNSSAVREAALRLSSQHRVIAVAYYGENAVRELETQDLQRIWREGLEWISKESNRRWGKAFLDVPEPSQVEVLKSLNEGHETENTGARLFALLKNQIIHGFYTSQRGLKELNYKGNAYYAECPGCNHSKPAPK
ncbi:MAG TPA: gluconate 2-dehydrogenase subunit 3 family protein [Terriglobia bacterium]|nr:gluconate 2-dehydrogenase subunit 3 family protein [Terriglobia bacterium]